MMLHARALAAPLLIALISFAVLPSRATADDLPAVSGPNGKLSLEGGAYDDDGAGIAVGSFALPLGHRFGAQAEGAVGVIDDEIMGGGGLHLFARNPESYLLGVFGGVYTWDSIDIWRIAGEGELYVNRFSFSGLAGYEDISLPSTINGVPLDMSSNSGFFAQADVAYYITDDFKVYGGYRYVDDVSLGAAGAEYLLRESGFPISLFAKSDFGNDDYTRVTGGIKAYFSDDPGKSLIDRHRMDDPDTYLPVFPKITQTTPTCKVNSRGNVDSPADGDCICPSGTSNAGSRPIKGKIYTCSVH